MHLSHGSKEPDQNEGPTSSAPLPSVRSPADLPARAHDFLSRRRRRFLVIVGVSGALAALAGGGSALLLGGGGALAVLTWSGAVWLVLVVAAVAPLILAELHPPRRVRLSVLATAAMLLVCAVPGSWWWTFAVDHSPPGEASPASAVVAYMGYAPWAGWSADATMFDRVLCNDRRGVLRAQAHRLAAAVADSKGSDAGVSVESGSYATNGDDRHATVTAQVWLQWRLPPGSGGGAMFADGGRHPWVFTTVNEDGWRVCGVQADGPCELVDSCIPATSAPATAPAPSPSPTDDPLAKLREMLPCGPRDPYRSLHTCPPGSTPTPG